MSRNPDRASKSDAHQETEPPAFEVAYAELQQVVDELERGELAGLDLERTVGLFQRGTQLVQLCERIVDAAELRVTRLAAETATPLSDVGGDA